MERRMEEERQVTIRGLGPASPDSADFQTELIAAGMYEVAADWRSAA
jgi:hypothetical protein